MALLKIKPTLIGQRIAKQTITAPQIELLLILVNIQTIDKVLINIFGQRVIYFADGEVVGLKGDLSDGLIKLGWDFANNQRLEFSYEHYQDEGDYSYRPDMGLATDLAITDSLKVPLLWPTEFTRETLTLNYQLIWGEASTLDAVVYSNTSELWRDEMGWTDAEHERTKSRAAIVTGEAKNTGINIMATTAIDGDIEHELTYGVDHVVHKTDYSAKSNTAMRSSEEEATNSSIFIEDNINLGQGFTLTPGARYDSYDIDSTVVDKSFSDVTFALALAYQLSDDLLVKVSSTQLFKGPEIGEVFIGAGLFDTANAEIEAETGLNTELAFAYQTAVNQGDMLSLGGTYFTTDIDNYIYDHANVPNGGPRDTWKDNVGEMTIDGYEVYAGYEHGAFSAQITFSSAESELNAFDGYQSLDGARLDRQQGDTISTHFDYHLSEFNLTLQWEMMSVDDVADGLSLDGASKDNAKDSFTIHNIQARWESESVDGLSVRFGVDNLFDEFYASQSSRTGTSAHPWFGDLYLTDYEPGRNVKATLAFSF